MSLPANLTAEPWADYELFWLRLGVQQGLSVREVGAVLPKRSRAAIIGKAWRLRLSWHHRHRGPQRRQPRPLRLREAA